MKIVHIAFECAPIYKTGGLGDVVGSLPKFQKDLGIDVTVLIPGYGFITRVPRLPNSTVPVIYAQSRYFREYNIKHDPKIQAPKYADFAIKALQLLKENNLKPDIIHCHDWHTGLTPFLLKTLPDPFFKNTKIVLSIHNIGFQGNFPVSFLDTAETRQLLPLFNKNKKRINFLKLGIEFSDYLLTVSPNHAREIKQGRVGFGLAGLVRKKRGKFSGILNGIDYQVWRPEKDKYLKYKFSKKSVKDKKSENKLDLQKRLKLEINRDIPLFGLVARLSRQKGIELLEPLLPLFPKRRLQLLILGNGQKKYEQALDKYKNKTYREWLSINIKFDEKLAHQIYGAADFFLIPSLYEPCGLTQMLAMAYGGLPLASAVGGLADTIKDGQTGLLFDKFSPTALLETIDRALVIWENQAVYLKMQQQAMKQNFSWEKSARSYMKLYHKLLKSSK